MVFKDIVRADVLPLSVLVSGKHFEKWTQVTSATLPCNKQSTTSPPLLSMSASKNLSSSPKSLYTSILQDSDTTCLLPRKSK